MKLSILIPSRNDIWLRNTINDVLSHIEDDTEIIVGLDAWNFGFDIWDDPKIQWIWSDESIGQRRMTNQLAKLSNSKYLMKLDSHCSLGQGFDRLMLEDMEDDITLVPALCDLDVKNWEVISNPCASQFCFNTDLEFRLNFNDKAKKAERELLAETMSIQGCGFMVSRDKYWELDLCEEAYGSWGAQGSEVALKTWLSGGRVLSTRKTYLGHYFRVKDDFPYQRDMEQVEHALKKIKDEFLTNSWSKQVRSIQWLIEKFDYPSNWSPENVAKLCRSI